jgi:membrane-bound lytic murein transglycosylase F
LANRQADSLSRIRERGEITVITTRNPHGFYIYRGEARGFEHDLAKAFADYLGVDLKVETFGHEDLIEALNEGRGDFVAAGIAMTPSRKRRVEFSRRYLSIQQRVVLHKDNRAIRRLKDLSAKTIHVRKGTSYEERLHELQQGGIDITVRLHNDTTTEELIKRVAKRKIELTIADSNVALLNRHYYPDVEVGIPIGEPRSLAWAVKRGERTLLSAINEFFERIRRDGTFDQIYKFYYGNTESFDRFDVKKFHERIRSRLPRFERTIRAAAREYGFDWRLIAAVIYQESHFDPEATSQRGVRGLMQLTALTAKEVGVTDRLDPEQSIMGGVKYLKNLYQQYDEAQGLDRMLIALASYNVGPRHVSNAQRIARERGLEPDKWSSLEQTLPLLCYEDYLKINKNGYCRGVEPVRYVNRILLYFDILRRQAVAET